MRSPFLAGRLVRTALVLAVLSMSACAPSSAADRDGTGSFIVVLAGDPAATPDAAQRVRAVADALARRYGGTVERVYGTALNGFAARMTPAQAKAMAADPRVRYVEADGEMRTQPTRP